MSRTRHPATAVEDREHEPMTVRVRSRSARPAYTERPAERRHRPCYFISIAAELAAVHPRTLRIYEEEGLLAPKRRNNLRLYSEADIERVRLIRFLTQRQGVNLAGVR